MLKHVLKPVKIDKTLVYSTFMILLSIMTMFTNDFWSWSMAYIIPGPWVHSISSFKGCGQIPSDTNVCAR